MIYPVCKVPHGRIGNDGSQDNGEWNREKDQCTTVAEDGEARWQDVSAGRE